MMDSGLPSAFGRSPSRRLLTRAAAACITGYQRYVSPYKGFSCAYRVCYQEESCSQYVKRILLESGIRAARIEGLERFAACREAHRILRAQAASGAAFMEPSWVEGFGQGFVQSVPCCLPVGCCWCSF